MKSKPFITTFYFFSVFSFLFSQGFVIKHTCTDISKIQNSWINQAKNQFRIYYEHTSHGSQIVSGMEVLQSVVGVPYTFNHSGSGTALSLHDIWDTDLGYDGDLGWADKTRDVLDQPGNDRNMVMWSWCGGVSDNTESGINAYLNEMNRLENEYPDVTFIYMTGHLDGTGESGNLHIRNNQIRNYCINNNKVLFDFADIESYDPDGNYFLDQGANDECYYNSGNWAQEWCSAHPGSELCSYCDCQHSEPLNCNLKGRAFWWMMAKLAGWNGDTTQVDSGYTVSPSSIGFGQVLIGNSKFDTLTITNTGEVAVTIDNIGCTNTVFSINGPLKKPLSDLPGFTLDVGESERIRVDFTPEAVQSYSGMITVYSSQIGDKMVSLSGQGYEIPSGGFHVSGDVSGAWSLYDTIYVDGDITVPNNQTLQISPVSGGTTILFTGHYRFNIEGRLLAAGTKTDTLFFTALDTLMGWHGFRFLWIDASGMDSSEIQYSVIQYGRANGAAWEDNQGGGIYLEESSPLISHVTFKHNSADNSGGGLYVGYDSHPRILHTVFTKNSGGEDGGGIYVTDSNHPIFLNITVIKNRASEGGGIACGSKSATFTNLVIRYNHANGTEWPSGGGLLCHANFTVSNADISNNRSNYCGGGVGCPWQSSPTLTNVTISYNSAQDGGGIACCFASNPHLTNVNIHNNTASGDGGGIYCLYDSNPILIKTEILNNSTNGNGGGLYVASSSPILKNVRIINNSANSHGGGVLLSDSSYANFQNCLIENNRAEWGGGILVLYSEGLSSIINTTIVQNIASNSGGGIGCDGGSPIIKNSILWNNKGLDQGHQVYLHIEDSDPYFSYCDIEGGLSGFEGDGSGSNYESIRYQNNIETYPLFVDSSQSDFRLNTGSPCIDTGDSDTTGLDLYFKDLNGSSRVYNDIVDIGCYEWQGSVNIEKDLIKIPAQFSMICNYPNPFNPETTFRFQLPKPQWITMTVYDILAHPVQILINGYVESGEHQIIFNGNHLPSGVYFYRFQSQEFYAAGKMVMVK